MATSRRVAFLGVATLAAAGLAAGLTLLTGDYRRELATARDRVGQGSRMVSTTCGPIEVAEAGRGPTLLVVHGSGGGFDQGLALGADYAARGWRVIAPSRFGYLRTPWPADAVVGGAIGDRQADHLACLLDAMGITDAAILGVSAGAIAATEFAVRHPQRTRALVVMVPAGYRPDPAPPLPAWAQQLLERLVAGDLPFWLAARFAPDTVRRVVLATPAEQYAAASDEERARADRMMREILPISARLPGLLHDTLATQAVPRPDFESIRAPTLVISARDDGFGTFASAAHAAQRIPGARLLGFERGGHLLLGHQSAVVSAVEALLRKTIPARGPDASEADRMPRAQPGTKRGN
jgi:pimeloyl-ACP methyl ester carboxylesterase